MQDFAIEGARNLFALTHITSATSEVPYGRIPGPAVYRALEALGF